VLRAERRPPSQLRGVAEVSRQCCGQRVDVVDRDQFADASVVEHLADAG
jgi:hypothetical protein